MNRMLALIAACILAVAGIAFAGGQSEGATAGTEGPFQLVGTWGIQHPGNELREDNVLDPLLLEKYDIKIEWIQIPQAEVQEKLTVMFASDDYPHVLWNHNAAALYNQLGMEGYVVDWLPLMDKVPAYRQLYTDFQWDLTLEARRASNNKLYYLPQFRPWAVTGGIVYRKDEFDRLGLEPPKTVDQLLENLRAIKQEHPDSVPWGNKWGIGQILLPLEMAYQCTTGLYVDPFTDELVPFGGITDKMREIIKVAHTMYQEELIDLEYNTVTSTQFEDKIRQDRVYMVAASFVGWLNKFNIINKPTNPAAEWALSKDMPTANGNHAYDPVVNGQPWGPAFTDRLQGDARDRYIEFTNWLSTDEGIVFQNYGVEGETYEVVAGEKQYVDWIDNSDPDKVKPAAMGMSNPTIWPWDAIVARYGTTAPLDYHNYILNNPQYRPFRRSYPFLFDSDMQRNEYLNLETIITDTYNEYRDKMIMGELDPYSDADWNAFLAEMKRSGIDKFMELSLAAYKRTYE